MTKQYDWISRLHAVGELEDIDFHFARFILDQAHHPSEELGLAAALVCHATSDGHVCLDLKQIAGQPMADATDFSPLLLPELGPWRDLLVHSGVVGRAGDYQPLILDQADRLYLHRYWDYEQSVARSLMARASHRIEVVDSERLMVGLYELFPEADQVDVDWQKVAAATAVLRLLSVISGGPGTGKTTTVIKILVLLRQQPGGERLRIGLAAPTGKAASRMQEAVRKAKASLSLPLGLADTVPEQASTLHRLLGVRQGRPGFAHHADNPLPLDVLILDEASMIDVALMAKLMDALPTSSRLILLGDKDQLASVEAGAVLGDICSGCTDHPNELVDDLYESTGKRAVKSGNLSGSICDSIVILRQSYRFSEDSAIGRLALAVNSGNAESAVCILTSQKDIGAIVHLHETDDVARYAADKFHDFLAMVESGAAVESLFQELARFRVLCALKHGPTGAIRLNQQIIALLRQTKIVANDEWFPGRLIMVTRNDYQQQLYNGDIGITLPHPEGEGKLAVVFQTNDATLRWLAPSRLPAYETVFAMTVHKAQGSEFDEVLLSLPETEAPLLGRELLYTAITRARVRFSLAAPIQVFKQAVLRRLVRNSGLANLLHDTDLF